MPPAIKGVQKAHRLFLVVGRARLQNRRNQHLNQPAADGIDADGNQNARERIRKQLRQDGQQPQPQRGTAVRQQNGGAIAYFIHEFCGQKVDQHLNDKVDGYQQRDAGQRDLIGVLKGHKQQRHKIVDHCLHDVADKAGRHRPLIRGVHVLRLRNSLPTHFITDSLFCIAGKSFFFQTMLFRTSLRIFRQNPSFTRLYLPSSFVFFKARSIGMPSA